MSHRIAGSAGPVSLPTITSAARMMTWLSVCEKQCKEPGLTSPTFTP